MVVSGSAAHPSNCTRLWCSKYPHSTRRIFLGKLKCVAQAQTTGRLTRSNAFARSRITAQALCFAIEPFHIGHGSLFFFCFSIQSFHFHQYFPHCTLSSSISPVGRVPIHANERVGALQDFEWCKVDFGQKVFSRQRKVAISSRQMAESILDTRLWIVATS